MSVPPLLSCRVALPLGRFSLAVDFASTQQVTGVFGPSGAGKTSLLEAVIGLRRGAMGRIALGDEVWLDSARGVRLAPEKRDVGYVPQAGLLFPHLTVCGNLAVAERRARARGIDVVGARREIVDVLELGPLLEQPARVLSGGERQRVALARALCSGPRLLVLDEPLASLDVAMQRRLLPFLCRVREAFSVPMLLVSHSPLEINALCDRVLAMQDGVVVSEGRPMDVLSSVSLRAASGPARPCAVFEVEARGHTSSAMQVRLSGSEVVVTVRGRHEDLGPRMLLSVPADAVILALAPPRELTAANVLAATVTQIDVKRPFAIVHCDLGVGLPPLLSEVTEDSLTRLRIGVGTALHAVFKASSCELVGGGGR